MTEIASDKNNEFFYWWNNISQKNTLEGKFLPPKKATINPIFRIKMSFDCQFLEK